MKRLSEPVTHPPRWLVKVSRPDGWFMEIEIPAESREAAERYPLDIWGVGVTATVTPLEVSA